MRRLLPALALLALAACNGSSKVTPENYSRIENGMSKDAVHDILGTPDEVSGGGIGKFQMLNETWKGAHSTIHVSFANDKVLVKTIE